MLEVCSQQTTWVQASWKFSISDFKQLKKQKYNNNATCWYGFNKKKKALSTTLRIKKRNHTITLNIFF